MQKELREANYKGKIISFYHNVEVLYFDAKISKLAPWRNLVLNCVDKNDSFCCKYSDKIITLNERDAKEIKKRYDRYADIIIPVVFKDIYARERYPSADISTKPKCMFLGAYFPANTEGILWFIKEVLPEVNIELTIVGKGMEKIKNDINLPDSIKLIANAPTLLPYFEEADIMILPIFKGSGMKVKTCESLMYGKNIIGSTEAFEGYELDYSKAGAKCDTKEEFIAAINDFIDHPRPRFNVYSRETYLQKYSEDAVISKFEEVLN